MCRFIESICVSEGQMKNLDSHQRRLNRTFAAFFPGYKPHNLSKIDLYLPDDLHKLRIIYDEHGMEIEIEPYSLPTIRTLRLMEADDVVYDFKYLQREPLNQLYDQKGSADDIVIVKDGLLTDSWFANLALFNAGTWYTPKAPLLRGTKREKLLREKVLTAVDIPVESVQDFSRACLINAMIDLGEIEVNFL